jgi:F-type H+-transporting ATPase subunit b
MELVQPGIGLIFWMTLSFAILLFILRKFAWKPIMKLLREREGDIEDSLRAAEKAKEEMKELKFSNEQLLKEAKEERDAILREARKIKEKLIDDAKLKANEEANRIVESAKERIENEKQAAMVSLKNEIASISIEVAEKILKQELSEKQKQQEYLSKLIDEAKLN